MFLIRHCICISFPLVMDCIFCIVALERICCRCIMCLMLHCSRKLFLLFQVFYVSLHLSPHFFDAVFYFAVCMLSPVGACCAASVCASSVCAVEMVAHIIVFTHVFFCVGCYGFRSCWRGVWW